MDAILSSMANPRQVQPLGTAFTSDMMQEKRKFRKTDSPWARRHSLSLGLQQPSRDDVRLNLGRSFENAENSRVAQYPARGKLFGESVSAVNLDRVVGSRPGDAGSQEFRHSGFQVAPVPESFFLAA